MEYEILQPGHELCVYYHVYNEEGIEAFTPLDNDPLWRRKLRPIGRYVSTAWIPGNFLSEGTYYIGPTIRTLNPTIRRLRVDDAVSFHVFDSMDGHGARVDFAEDLSGVVRPLLKWETQFSPKGNSVATETIIGEANS
jgi:lipopolysaccharide transport system ATP-binding protein